MEQIPQQTPSAVEPGWLRALALQAGEHLVEASRRRGQLRVDHKGRIDLVTETDLAIQELLVSSLRAAFPGDRIVAEEGDQPAADDRSRVWYVDPVDGTTNFVHGHPFCAVSIARWVDDEPEIGVVWAPFLDELFFSRSGNGATLERPLRGEPPAPVFASGCVSLDQALVGTGFPYHRGRTARLNLAICAHALERVRGLRRGGSAALDLCHVAMGRLDAYWEMGLSAWDLGAAALVAREAGAIVTDFTGAPGILDGSRVAAAAPGLHAELLALLERAHRRPDLEVLGDAPPDGFALRGSFARGRQMSDGIVVVMTTVGDAATARQLARGMVEQGLAACAQIEISPIHSVWRWEGEVQDGPEWRLMFKTVEARVDDLRRVLLDSHPYDTPEFVVLTGRASTDYARWAEEACRP